MSKTPYEIRLELLTLAKEILQTPIYQKRETLSDEYHSKLNDANRGILIPRVSLAAVTNGTTPVATPLTGLLVYNTNAAVTGGAGTGFYFWNGTQWTPLKGGVGELATASVTWSIDGAITKVAV